MPSASAVSPPLPARTAFLIAAIAAVLVAATFVPARRLLGAGVDRAVDAFDAFQVRHPQPSRAFVGAVGPYLILLGVAGLLGWFVARGAYTP